MIIENERTIGIAEAEALICAAGPANIFSVSELDHYFNGTHYSRLAARFLAKQIIYEHLNAQIERQYISVGSGNHGKPIVTFPPTTAPLKTQTGVISQVHVSLSHSRNYARALVIFEYF